VHCGMRTHLKPSSKMKFDSLKRLLDRCIKLSRGDFRSKFSEPMLRAYQERNVLRQEQHLGNGKYVGLTPKRRTGSKKRGRSPIDNFLGKRNRTRRSRSKGTSAKAAVSPSAVKRPRNSARREAKRKKQNEFE
jgi:hypothetical protein